MSNITEIEKTNLFEKVITGSHESPISQVIQALKNSDWIKQGLHYLEK